MSPSPLELLTSCFSRFAPVSEVSYNVRTCSYTPENIEGDYTVEIAGRVPATLIDSFCDLNVSTTVRSTLPVPGLAEKADQLIPTQGPIIIHACCLCVRVPWGTLLLRLCAKIHLIIAIEKLVDFVRQ